MVAMRRLLLIAAALLGLSSVAPAALATTRFLTGSEDVPLMEGLAEVPDSRIIFDTPGGRIVDVDTAGAVSADDVARFYRQSLPALGWKLDQPADDGADKYVFRRSTEILVITVHGQGDGDGAVGVRFNLRPHAL